MRAAAGKRFEQDHKSGAGKSLYIAMEYADMGDM